MGCFYLFGFIFVVFSMLLLQYHTVENILPMPGCGPWLRSPPLKSWESQHGHGSTLPA